MPIPILAPVAPPEPPAPPDPVVRPRRPVVIFGDVVAAMVDHLDDELDNFGYADVVVTSNVPNPRPPRLVVLELTGGTDKTQVSEKPQVSVDCWAPTKPEAHDLAQRVRASIKALRATRTQGMTFYRVSEFAGPSYQPDPLAPKVPRFAFTVEVHVRGNPA